MKKIFITFLSVLTLASLSLAACQPAPQTTPAASQTTAGAAGLKVLAVESFLADMTQNVAGDHVQVDTLMPLGLDPHAYQPTPQDVVKIAESQVLIVNGAGFEEWLDKTIANAGGERTLVEASAGLTSRQAREGEEAVMSPEEKVDAVCSAMDGQSAGEEIQAGADAASAAAGLTDGLVSLKLNPAADGGYSGAVRFAVAEDGEYVIAADGGAIAVTDESGAAMAVEESLAVNCFGLDGAVLLDLEPGSYVIAVSGVTAETTPFFAGSLGGHHHHEGDPHFWLDPLSVVQYVENIRDGLIAADPAGADTYTQNAAAYIDQLKELDAWIRQQVSVIPEERRLIVTNHESFGYFADRYGFKIVGTIIPSVSTGASPSAQQMARLLERIRSTGAIAIFLETGSNPQLAEQISQETGIKVVSELYTHSITGPDGQASTYIDMMKYNVQAIVDALK